MILIYNFLKFRCKRIKIVIIVKKILTQLSNVLSASLPTYSINCLDCHVSSNIERFQQAIDLIKVVELAKDGGRDCRPLVTRNKCGSSSTSSQWQLHKCPFLRSWEGNSLECDRRVSKCKFDIVAKTKQYQGCISSTRHISSIVFLLFCVYPLL